MHNLNQPPRDTRRGGMIATYVAIAMLPILGVMALVIDIGMVRARGHHVQAASDAAALAAAVELFNNSAGLNSSVPDPTGAARAAAVANLKANGYTDANSNIAINIPPQHSESGFNGRVGYAEVIINFKQQRYFSAIFGSEDILIGGHAIARGVSWNAEVGILALDRHKDAALSSGGNGDVAVHGGSIVVNSNSETALVVSGDVEASSHEITGNYDSSNGNLIGPVRTGVPPLPDPLRHLPEPDPAVHPIRATSATRITGNTSVVFQPGVYVGGLEVVANGSAELLPGIYIMQGGGFEMSGNGDVIAEGVMIYLMSGSDSGGIKITGNGSASLSPPASGPYRGISLFQQRSYTEDIHLSGNGDMRVTGMVYAPAAEVNLSGNGSGDVYGGAIIANSVAVSGNGNVTVDREHAPPVMPEMVRLVE